MSIYWNSGQTDGMDLPRDRQGRMDKPFWQRRRDTYIKNSPIFNIDDMEARR